MKVWLLEGGTGQAEGNQEERRGEGTQKFSMPEFEGSAKTGPFPSNEFWNSIMGHSLPKLVLG